MTEWFVSGSDAALCKIASTTCWNLSTLMVTLRARPPALFYFPSPNGWRVRRRVPYFTPTRHVSITIETVLSQKPRLLTIQWTYLGNLFVNRYWPVAKCSAREPPWTHKTDLQRAYSLSSTILSTFWFKLILNTQGEMTSQNLQPRYVRHFVGITLHNVWS